MLSFFVCEKHFAYNDIEYTSKKKKSKKKNTWPGNSLYQLFKTIQRTKYSSLPGKGEGGGEGWALGNDNFLLGNYSFPQFSFRWLSKLLVWQNEWAILFFIQTGVWNYKSTGLCCICLAFTQGFWKSRKWCKKIEDAPSQVDLFSKWLRKTMKDSYGVDKNIKLRRV